MEVSQEERWQHWFSDPGAELDRESLNLVEFPLALLARKVPKDTKVVTFEDRITDKSSGAKINRKLTISANAETELPNYWDQDVLLALSVLTWRKNRFTDPTVEFSFFEILQLMGLSDQGANCKRLAKSFDNWLGLRFKWTHWWTGDAWENPKATVLLQDYDLTRRGNAEPTRPQVFTWSRLYFEAMQSGNRKPFDSEFYFGLDKPSSRRLYRYLDKRFFNRVSYRYPVAEFCTEKLGIARGRKPSQYPAKIQPAYDELVSRGYLADLPKSKRYERDNNGKLHVNFRRGRRKKTKVATSGVAKQTSKSTPIEQRLIAHGMTASVAMKWARSEPLECERQLEYLEFKLENGWKSEKGKGGYLNAAIAGKYAAPEGFKSKLEREQEAKAREEKRAKRKKQEADAAEKRRAAEEVKARQLKDFMESLGDRREEFEERAIANAKPFIKGLYKKSEKGSETEKNYLELMWRDEMHRKQGDASNPAA